MSAGQRSKTVAELDRTYDRHNREVLEDRLNLAAWDKHSPESGEIADKPLEAEVWLSSEIL